MGKVAIHYGWIPMILYMGDHLSPLEPFGPFAFPVVVLIAGYTQSSPRPAAWKYSAIPK
jgi:hypothetical protein